jgi:transmembrane sensor
MLRLFSEVPGYLLTAISAIGLLLFAQLLYVLFRDGQYPAIGFGLILISAILLLRVIRRNRSKQPDESAVLEFVARLGVPIAAALVPMLLAYRHTVDNPIVRGSLSTPAGAYHCEDLPDGSNICLNTQSAVKYAFSEQTRNVEVLSGEASFAVRIDKSRPFNVASGKLLVHDISTEFNVYNRNGSTVLTVIEGRVKVIAPISPEMRRRFDAAEVIDGWKTAPEYRKFQQVEFDETTGTLQSRPDLSEQRLSQFLAWKDGWIALDGLTLAEALAEFSRYQPTTKFRFSDGSLGQIPVGGSMAPAHLDDFLDALESLHHIRHTLAKEANGDTVITLSRH